MRKDTETLHLLLLVAFQPSSVRVRLVVLGPSLGGLGYECRPLHVVPLLRHRHMDLVGDELDPASLQLLLHSVRQQCLARNVPHVHHTLFGVRGRLDDGDSLVGDDGLDVGSVLRRKVGKPDNVDLVDDKDGGLVGE